MSYVWAGKSYERLCISAKDTVLEASLGVVTFIGIPGGNERNQSEEEVLKYCFQSLNHVQLLQPHGVA